MNRFALAAAVLIAWTGLSTTQSIAQGSRPTEETKVEKSFAGDGVNSASLDIWIGNVRVFADSRDAITVKAVRRAEGGSAAERHRWLATATAQIEKLNGVVMLKDIVPQSLRGSLDHQSGRGGLSASLNVEVHLPRRLGVYVIEKVGDIHVGGIGGGVKLNTGFGSLALTDLHCAGKPVSVHVGAGNVTIDGDVGDLTLAGGASGVRASRIRFSGRFADLHVGTGEMDVSVAALPTEHLKIDAGIGAIRLSLPADSRGKVSASTGMGVIQSSLQLSVPRRTGGEMGGRLTGDLNGAGPLLELHTGLGELHLAAR